MGNYSVYNFKQAAQKGNGWNTFKLGFIDSNQLQNTSKGNTNPTTKKIADNLDYQFRTFAGDQPVSINALWAIAGDNGQLTVPKIAQKGEAAIKANITTYERAANDVGNKRNEWNDLKNKEQDLNNRKNSATQNKQFSELAKIDAELNVIKDKMAFFTNHFDF
jgi:hypothetical protein